jgi:hypothetical protein
MSVFAVQDVMGQHRANVMRLNGIVFASLLGRCVDTKERNICKRFGMLIRASPTMRIVIGSDRNNSRTGGDSVVSG